MFGRAKMLLTPLLFILASFFVGCSGEAETKANLNLETAKAKAETCVEPTADMRTNHMKYLLHERDETMYDGIRGKKHSFKACINCHVPAEKDGKPVNYLVDDHATAKLNTDHFCATCHAYVSVKLDCFECHSDNPESSEIPANHAAMVQAQQGQGSSKTVQEKSNHE